MNVATGDWRESGIDERERYQRYLCSREWAILKEQVKQRSGGICERCRFNRSDAVHHLTYIRKYCEILDDLQDICNACHEFTHGKRARDPIMDAPLVLGRIEIKSVYLAGRISGGNGNWRSEIVPGWQVGGGATWWKDKGHSGKWATGSTDDPYDWSSRIIDNDAIAVCPDGRTIAYSGPLWLDVWGGHGGGLGPHALADDWVDDDLGACRITKPNKVINEIRAAILGTSLVFAWIDSREALGALIEVGYACAKGFGEARYVVVAMPEWDRELWVAGYMADRCIIADSAGKAWDRLWMDSEKRPPGEVVDP